MSTGKTIEIIVRPDGSTSLETRGFSGSECRAASEFLEQALGSRASERLTGEFHQEVSTDERNQLRSGL